MAKQRSTMQDSSKTEDWRSSGDKGKSSPGLSSGESSSNGSGGNSPEFNARVARKAYELFERRGGDVGQDVQDWLEAERLVREEMQQENSAR